MRVVYTRLLFWADGFALCPGLVFIHPNFRHDAGQAGIEASGAKPENRKGRRSAQVILRAVRRASQDVPGSGQEPRQPAEQGPQGLEVLTC